MLRESESLISLGGEWKEEQSRFNQYIGSALEAYFMEWGDHPFEEEK